MQVCDQSFEYSGREVEIGEVRLYGEHVVSVVAVHASGGSGHFGTARANLALYGSMVEYPQYAQHTLDLCNTVFCLHSHIQTSYWETMRCRVQDPSPYTMESVPQVLSWRMQILYHIFTSLKCPQHHSVILEAICCPFDSQH